MTKRSGFGWIECITGICMVILGIFTLIKPHALFSGLAILYGIITIVTGVCDIVLYIKAERYTGFGPVIALISGILSIMVGVFLLSHPNMGSWIISILFPLWFITHCISRLSQLNIIRFTAGDFYYYCSLIISVLGLILGFMMLFKPAFTVAATGMMIGIYLIICGIESIILAFSDIGRG